MQRFAEHSAAGQQAWLVYQGLKKRTIFFVTDLMQ